MRSALVGEGNVLPIKKGNRSVKKRKPLPLFRDRKISAAKIPLQKRRVIKNIIFGVGFAYMYDGKEYINHRDYDRTS
jgi:hypothetical protein